MNAGIVCLKDGTPCITYDEILPCDISHVEFNETNHQLTLMYDREDDEGRVGYEFPFPLDPPFTALLRERGNVAVAFIQEGQPFDFNIYNVIFVDVE